MTGLVILFPCLRFRCPVKAKLSLLPLPRERGINCQLGLPLPTVKRAQKISPSEYLTLKWLKLRQMICTQSGCKRNETRANRWLQGSWKENADYHKIYVTLSDKWGTKGLGMKSKKGKIRRKIAISRILIDQYQQLKLLIFWGVKNSWFLTSLPSSF